MSDTIPPGRIPFLLLQPVARQMPGLISLAPGTVNLSAAAPPVLVLVVALGVGVAVAGAAAAGVPVAVAGFTRVGG